MNFIHAFLISTIACLFPNATYASDTAFSANIEPITTVDSTFKLIFSAPQWDYHAFESGKDRELLNLLFTLGNLKTEEIRAIVTKLMQEQDKAPTRNTWFKVYVINRLIFDIPHEATWRDTPRILGGFGRPPEIESATWPLLFRENNKVRISSRSAGYSGPDYQGLEEFDAFSAIYSRRDLTKLSAGDSTDTETTDWLISNGATPQPDRQAHGVGP